MISLFKILKENYQFDADDYIPFDDIKEGDTVRSCQGNELFTVLEKLDQNRLIVQSEDSGEILPVFFDKEVTSHESDQTEEDDDYISEVKEELGIEDPEFIINFSYDVVAKGRGFNKSEIIEGLKKAEKMFRRRGENFTYLDINNCPGSITGGDVVVYSEDAEDIDCPWSYAERYSYESLASDFEKLLKSECKPEDLESHVIGWIIAGSTSGRHGIYPMLDKEGVQMYWKAEDALDDSVHDFYKDTNYWGD